MTQRGAPPPLFPLGIREIPSVPVILADPQLSSLSHISPPDSPFLVWGLPFVAITKWNPLTLTSCCLFLPLETREKMIGHMQARMCIYHPLQSYFVDTGTR